MIHKRVYPLEDERLRDEFDRVDDNLVRLSMIIPTGISITWHGEKTTIPEGWLLMDGRLVLQSSHRNLFQKIGHIHFAEGDNLDDELFRLPGTEPGDLDKSFEIIKT